MAKHTDYSSELWTSINWGRLSQEVFNLQTKIYKAVKSNDMEKCLRFQKLLFNSYSARMIAIRQVTQLNKGKKTAGIDGKKNLNFKERFLLEKELKEQANKWKHEGLREIKIPKPDGSKRVLKVPTIKDRAWQALVKLILEPAHEATFHPRSYGFRAGRSTHDAQKHIYDLLRKQAIGYKKQVIELDIEKCFDRISHKSILDRLIAPQYVKHGIFRCLKAGVNPKFPEQGTPQGGVVSPLLANIALNGIEDIHKTAIRYADDIAIFIRPDKGEKADKILIEIESFLSDRGMKISEKKTKITPVQKGFDFLGWEFRVTNQLKTRCIPSNKNYKNFKSKVKTIVNANNDPLEEKVKKLARIVRGWRNYHKYCYMKGSKNSLYYTQFSALLKFKAQNKNLPHKQAVESLNKAFPAIPWKQGKFVKVKGNKSPYDGDLIYWAKRKAKQFDNWTAKMLQKQGFRCKECGNYFIDNEEIHLHHIDGNHSNFKHNNLEALHMSCHYNKHLKQKDTKA